ncbi:MAG: CHAT domain-containing protein [Flammeovirgaceae bacterium]|nr:CHAT domain-containing protein [Flammeovirgaceae bacterium]
MRFLFLLLFPLIYFQAVCQDWKSVNKKASSYIMRGKYAEAIIAANQALELATHQFGKNTSQYMASLSNKGYAQAGLGDYLQALSNFKQVVNLSFLVYNLPHVGQVESLAELSKTYAGLATYDSAEYYLNWARFVLVSIPKDNKAHYDTASYDLFDAQITTNSLDASIHYSKGQVPQAIQLLELQLTMLKEIYPDNYESWPTYQTTVNNLFTYNNEIYNIDQALRYALLYYRLIQIKPDPLNEINALQNLGSIYSNREQYDSANFYWQEALERIANSNYKNFYLHTAILNNLGTLKLALESYDSAIFLLRESLLIQQSKEALQPALHKTTLFNLAESYHWAGNYAQADSIYNDLIQSLLDDIVHNFTYLTDNEKLAFYKNQLEFIESYKSFALNISGLIPLQDSETPYINKEIPGRLFDLQLTTKAVILNASKRMKKNILQSGDTILIKIYSLWEERKNQLAQGLVEGKMPATDLHNLKVKIEENEKWLAENSRTFRSGFQFEKVTWRTIQKSLKPKEAAVEIVRLVDGLVYGALIITPETTQQPVMSLVMSTKSKHLDKQFYKNYYNSITLHAEDSLSYKTYWQPIIDSIRSHMPKNKMPQRICLSNDGIYNQLNLNTLRDPRNGKYALDETDLVVVTNTKDILNPRVNSKKSKNHNAALFGRPQYSKEGEPGKFVDLPGTGKEVELLSRALMMAKWQTQLFMGEDATEKNLKNLNEPTVLHLASHGFFNPGEGSESYSLAETMIRSGIALAGVNDSDSKEEDGLLTAFEVINLNLDSTLLVVLSACETANGDVNHGEGVYGLQRALRVAGAQNMIMSLWKVDDEATQKLMVDFYSHWLKTKDMRASFRAAQENLRREYPNPYYWGAFILTR